VWEYFGAHGAFHFLLLNFQEKVTAFKKVGTKTYKLRNTAELSRDAVFLNTNILGETAYRSTPLVFLLYANT